MQQRWGGVFFKAGEGGGQGLIIKDKKIYFSEVGEKGDRAQLRVMFVPLGIISLLSCWNGFERSLDKPPRQISTITIL